jgi:WD40-like Beta Propeller Repeat
VRATVLALLVLILCVGCDSGERAREPAPPPGHYLVYDKLIDEKGIWIADADGRNPRLLVRDGSLPAISPDGRWVAYSAGCEMPGFNCDKAMLVGTGAGDKPRLLGDGLGGTMRWTPDSKRLVTQVGPLDEVNEIATIDVASGEVTRLVKGKLFGWSLSPNGTQIVFARAANPHADMAYRPGADLFVVGVDGGAPKRLTETGDAIEPVWGPKSIAFAKVISCFGRGGGLRPPAQAARMDCFNNSWGRDEIWRIQPDGTGRTPITAALPREFQNQGCIGLIPIDWSEDGRALLAAWRCEFSDSPVAVDLDTGAPRALPWWAAETAGLSRDGRFALVRTDTGPETPPAKETVLIFPYAGGKPKLVARGARDPSWNR